MFEIKPLSDTEVLLEITLPSNETQEGILKLAQEEFTKDFQQQFFGKKVKINGRITTSLSMWLGHALAHITKEILLFDPKENLYISVLRH